MYEQNQLFDFMLSRVKEVASESGLRQPQAFGRWFAETYFHRPEQLFVSDGSKDGKVDLFFHTSNGKDVNHHVVNAKFTEKYNVLAPVAFYDEITRFWQSFANRSNRNAYLALVRPELKQRYKRLYDYYDSDNAQLLFVTNYRRNEPQYRSVRSFGVEIFHLDDVLQFMADYIEDTMPRTAPLLLTGVSSILSADKRDTEVPTSIVFARLVDFIQYMETDPYDLLFARNIRLSLGSTPVNKEIRQTFEEAPKEFVFSNNGITMLCEKHSHNPGRQEVTIINPRIVNGSQTLHSIRDVGVPSSIARVMVRIIEVAPPNPSELPSHVTKRKDIIGKISIRSNRQNPIKKWNLVSNDDFQHELARYFRKKKLYYERRDREWSFRRTELKSVGIGKGPNIKWLTQLIASYYWDRKQLGPAVAKGGLGELFDGKPYEIIKTTPPELAYQLYLLDFILADCISELSRKRRYIQTLSRHMWQTFFAVCVRALQSAGAQWGHSKLTAALELEVSRATHAWVTFAKLAVDPIRRSYKADSKRYQKTVRKHLSFNNFFKAQTYVGRIFSQPISRALEKYARKVLA